jgi:hypothetical protein
MHGKLGMGEGEGKKMKQMILSDAMKGGKLAKS